MKKSVLLCFPPLSPLGDKFYFRTEQLINSLKKDFQVKIIKPLSKTGYGKDRKFSFKKALLFILNIPIYLKKISRVDIILIFPTPLWYFWISAAKALKKKIIIDHFITSLYPFEMRKMSKALKKIFFKLDQLFYPKVDLIITHTQTLKNKIANIYKVNKNKVITVYSLVDTELFDPAKYSAIQKRKLKTNYQIPRNKKIILYHGKFHPFHGLSLIKKIAGLSFKEKKNLIFVFVGRKEENRQNMYFIDFIRFKKLPQVLSLADLWIGRFDKKPRARRAASSCMLQAMAMKIPVLTYASRENEFIIKNKRNGFLIKTLGPKKILLKIEKTLQNKKQLIKIGINARKTIKTHFPLEKWQKVNQEIKKL